MSYKKLSETARIDFANRLNEICDEMGLPEKFKGRQVSLAEIFYKITGEKITPNAARKWIEGEGLPSTDKISILSRWANVESEWLISGYGEKRTIKAHQYAHDSIMYKIIHVAEEMSEYKRNLAFELMRTLAEMPNADPAQIKAESDAIAAVDATIKRMGIAGPIETSDPSIKKHQ